MTFVEKRGVFLGGGCLQFGRGVLGWGRRRRNRGGEGRQSGDILTLTEGIANGILLSVISSSVGDSLGNFDGELVTSLYGDSSWNPLVIPLVKSHEKTITSSNCFF